MDGKFLAAVTVILLWSGCVRATGDHQLCPKHCKCTKSINDDLVARCSVLDDSVQRFAPSVKHLVVEDGRLPTTASGEYTLKENMFKDLLLGQVITVRIVNSSLKAVHPRAFSDLSYLEDLDLSYNRISKLDPDVFSTNIRLERVRLRGNPIRLPEDGGDERFVESATVTELDMSECAIEKLGRAPFAGLQFVKVLSLTANRITRLNSGSFSDLGLLTELNLDRNRITEIDPKVFENLKQLYSLNLAANPIESLDGIDIAQLSDLDVSQCHIKRLTEKSFSGLNQLVSLNASSNWIESVDGAAFAAMPDLAHLDLSNNNIRGPLPHVLFEANKQLETIRLSGNREMHVAAGFDTAFDKLYLYDISDCGLGELSDDSFAGMNYLATLNASGNSLQSLGPDTFRNLRHLIKLDLSRNKLRNLPAELFRSNVRLHRLYLAGNLFHYVPAHALEHCPELSLLDMSGNRLVYLWNTTRLEKDEQGAEIGRRYPFGRLVYLNLAGNRLKRFRAADFKRLKSLGKIDISGNPIECSADFARFVEWLIEQRVAAQKGLESSTVELAARGEAERIEWDGLTRSVCPPPPPPPGRPAHHPEDDEWEDDDGEEGGTENNVITIDEDTATAVGGRTLANLKIVGVGEGGAAAPLWPVVVVAVVSMCLLCVLFNVVGVLLARRRYKLVSYKSQFASPLGGLSQVRRPDSSHHIYHKLYEDCSVPNTPIVKKGKNMEIISYLRGNIEKAPIQDV